MMKINVLQVCSHLGLGGIEKSLQIITKYLDKNIFDVSVCVLVAGGVREMAIKEMGIRVYNVNKSPEKFVKLIKDKKIHVVHFHGTGKEFPVFIKAAKEAGVLAIILMDAGGKIIDPKTSKLIDRHLISKMIALRYKKWCKMSNEEFHKNCRVLYYPIDLDETERFKMSSDEILRERKKLGIEPNDLVIGGIGRPDISKWGDIVDIISHLIKRVPNVKYLAMGLPELKKMEIRRRNLDKYFVFLSPDPNVAKFYCLIDIFALSSSRGGETFGRTIAEAMSYQKPVVARSTPLADNAQIELVDNGKTGFVVYSSKGFSEAIAYLASNRAVARRMGLAGYEKMKREYEAKKITKMLEKRIIELSQARGMELPKKVLKRYEKVHYSPSSKEIDNFELEYRRRLKDCFDKPDLIKLFVYKYVVSKPLMLKVVKSVRLTNLRNMIMRFRERWRVGFKL